MNSQHNPHILSHYQESLNELENHFFELAHRVLDKVSSSGKLIAQPDENSTNRLIASFPEIDDEARAITQRAKMILLQYQPFAGDLRRVICIMRATDRVDEINREVLHIAKTVKKLIPEGKITPPSMLSSIFNMAHEELADSIEAFQSRNSLLARSIKARDKELDVKHRELMQKLIVHISEHRYAVAIGLHFMFLVRAIERIGDHAKAIAASSIFLNEGKDIRHPGHSSPSPLAE